MRPAAILILIACALASARAQSDVRAQVAAARQALGGDAALSAITSLTASGSVTARMGPGFTNQLEFSYVAPDKFLRTIRSLGSGPGPIQVGVPIQIESTRFDGFNGSERIRETVSPFPLPPMPAGPQPRTAEEIAAARTRSLSAAQDIFIEFAVPLLIALPADFGLSPSAGGRVTFDKIETEAIDLRRADGKSWRLLLDVKTNLPVALTWRAKPIVMMSTSRTMTTTVVQGKGGLPPAGPPRNIPPPDFPSGDPTAGLTDVDWMMRIREYKVADGLNWPRRLVTSFDGKEWEDVRISRYRINPRIDLKIFDRKNK